MDSVCTVDKAYTSSYGDVETKISTLRIAICKIYIDPWILLEQFNQLKNNNHGHQLQIYQNLWSELFVNI